MGNSKERTSSAQANRQWRDIGTANDFNRSYSGNGRGSNGRGSSGYNNNNNNNNNSSSSSNKRENKVIIISNLNLLTKPETIHSVFSKYGNLYSVDLNTDEKNVFDGSATIQFHSMPRAFDISKPLRIDGRVVTLKYGATLSEEQRPTFCNANRLSLGILLTPTEFVEEWYTDVGVKLSVFYDNRQLKADFNHLGTTYILEIKFKDITNDVVVENIGNATYLTIPLKQPAMFSYFNNNVQVTNSKSAKSQICRANKIPLNASSQPVDAAPASRSTSSSPVASSPGNTSPTPTGSASKAPIQLHTDDKHLQLETWTVYRIKFDASSSVTSKHQINKLLNAMADYHLVPRLHQEQRQSLTVTPAAKLPTPKNHQDRKDLLEFDVLYMLECCITQNLLLERNLDDEFYESLARLVAPVACGILEFIAQDKKRVWEPLAKVNSIWRKHKMKVTYTRKIPDHCSMLRKFIVTPTSVYVQPPTLETTNRIIRHFKSYADRFIRVQFTDEDLMRIGPSFDTRNKESIYDRVYQTLTNGIMIGDRRYDYLGFSSSQLREHGCWFFAPYEEDDNVVGQPGLEFMNAAIIRHWMGDFSDIKIVAKHAARIGQCFSSTRAIIELQREQVETIGDIVHNNYTFSDGVGNISYELASEIARRMSIRVVPTAFQFRLGGAKGVLMVSPRLVGAKVQLRPSQIKFTSEHYMVEIVRTSSHISAYLNRQAITLLSSLGVKDEVFMKKLNNILSGLEGMLKNSEQAIAILQRNADEFGISNFMANIIGAGYLDRQDSFIKNLVNLFRVMVLKNLKEKAKIPIDEGAFLFGVVDETGTLKADEVFCQVSSDSTQTLHTVIKGKCMVFRNPCFHPGDIRVLTAVDYPSLHHLKDVLVFPSVGYRDIPSMCSGGDLDGDDYTILWDESLMPSIVNQPPMDYTPKKPQEKDRVKTKDIQKFFVKYMNSDNLGQIANAHLATADDSEKGAMDGRCKRLAQLHSSAVDFPKTGEPSKFEDDLKVHRFPDFMAKEDKPMYRSKKVLGQMFRRIDKADYDKYESKLVGDTKYDSRLKVTGMESFIADARRLRQQYNRDLTSLMNQYGVKTEAEMISGFVITWLKRGNRKSDYELQKQSAAAVATMRQMWKDEFMREFIDVTDTMIKGKRNNKSMDGNTKNKNDSITITNSSDASNRPISKEKEHLMEAKAAAWYYVTYHPNERARDLSVEGSYFSFAWIMDDILVRLGRRFKNITQTEIMPPIDENLIKSFEVVGSDNGFVVTVVEPDDDNDDSDDDDDEGEDDDDDDNNNNNNKNNDDDDDEQVNGDGNDNVELKNSSDSNIFGELMKLANDDVQNDGDNNNNNNNNNNNGDDDDGDNENDDDDDEEEEEDDDDDDDDDEDEDDEDHTKVISLDLCSNYDGTQKATNLDYKYQPMVPSNRDHQMTIEADATEDDLAKALL